MWLLCKIPGIKQIHLLCFTLLIHFTAGAQKAELNFINFNYKDGLSSNNVNVILKDRYGYMWFGTSDGLNRFDGVGFTVYRHRNDDTNSIAANNVHAMVEDNDGNLWVGTDQSLSFYDRKKDAFVNYSFVKNCAARAVAIDHLGAVWVGSYAGLFQFIPSKGVSKYFWPDPQKPGSLGSGTILSIFEDSRRRLWIGTKVGLHIYNRESDTFTGYVHKATDPGSIAGNLVRSITETPDGSIWAATDRGLSQLSPEGKIFKNYRHSLAINSLGSDDISVVAPDHSGHLWIGTEKGLNILDRATGKFQVVSQDPRNKYSLMGKSVRTVFIDNNGIYWVAAYPSGVNKYDKNLSFFNLRQSNPLDPSGLNYPTVTSFVENAAGDIYMGTDGGGLNLLNRSTGLFSHIDLNKGKSKQNLSILAMERAGDDIWIGTYRDGIYLMNMKSGSVKQYRKGYGKKDISGNEVFCIKKDSEGKVWIGTNGQGVNVFDPLTGNFRRFAGNAIPTGEKFLTTGYIRSIEEDKSGNIWIGTQGSALAMYDRKADSFRLYNRYNSGLPSNNVTNIYADLNDDIWVGTSGGGLSFFDKNKGSFVSYSEKDGLSNAIIYKIMEDGDGRIWVSTNKGISSFDQKQRKFKNYSFQNGLQRSSFCLGAGMKTSKGELFFGGMEGFNYFNPQSLSCNKNVPALVFTDLKISNSSVSPGENSPIKEHITTAEEIRLDHKQNFSLEFAALNYTSPLENRYSYKLDGFDRNWNEVGAQRTAVYTNLDPGEYTFRVRAKSDDGMWSSPEKTIRIYVKPPFWRTGYAYILYGVAVLLLILLMRYRTIRKIKNQFALQQERLQFQKMLDEEKRERERQHEFDELKIKFLTNLSHEFRTPISLIVGPIEKMAGVETRRENLEQLNLVKRNARRLLNLVNQLLDFRNLEENESKLNCTEGDLVSFTRDIADSFKDISEKKDINFNFSSSLAYYHTVFDKDKIERILFNLLSNAIKFTEKGGNISVSIEADLHSKVKIIISDTGMGMSDDEKIKIFERFFQGELRADILNQGSGIGLSIAREFIKLHGGDIDVQSEPGKGSVFTVSLPCEPVSLLSNVENPVAKQKIPDEVPGPEKLTVLLIEDNDDFRTYLRDNLKSNYKIVEAANGKEGWQKALSAHPKVIVSDVSMPGMDGIMLSRKLKSDKRTRHIPVILLTALTGHANQLKGLQTGASDYLTKPFNFEILQIKIKNLLALNQSFENTYSKLLKITAPEIEVESHDERLMLKITQYIESNMDSPDLSVEDLSKHVFMSRGSLYSKIVSITGETPVEFMRSIKLNKARLLLESSDMKIAEIAYAVGFSTSSYFARAFKAKFNVSPTEYVYLKKGDPGSCSQSSKYAST